MAKIELHPDFKDFLRLLNLHNVKYLLVGGYAVGYHGYPRATGDMDIWIEISEVNSKKYDSRNYRHLREVTVIAGRLPLTLILTDSIHVDIAKLISTATRPFSQNFFKSTARSVEFKYRAPS